MPAAIFNVDHTLFDAHVTETFHAYALEHGIPKRTGALKLRATSALGGLVDGVAARNRLLKLKGYHPARELARILGRRLQHRFREDEEPEGDEGMFKSRAAGGEREEGDG